MMTLEQIMVQKLAVCIAVDVDALFIRGIPDEVPGMVDAVAWRAIEDPLAALVGPKVG